MPVKKTHDFREIHDLREEKLIAEFERNIGRRIFLLLEVFPFLVIGRISDVNSGFISVDVETSHVPIIENNHIYINILDISAFHIDKPGQPKTPRINSGSPNMGIDLDYEGDEE